MHTHVCVHVCTLHVFTQAQVLCGAGSSPLPGDSIWNLAGIVPRPCLINTLVKGYLVAERYIKGHQDETEITRVSDYEKISSDNFFKGKMSLGRKGGL